MSNESKVCDCNQGRMPCTCRTAEPGTGYTAVDMTTAAAQGFRDGQSSQWQPIETVPKDGTEVILAKGDRVSSGAFIVWKQSDSEFSSTGVYLGEVEYDSGESFGTWDGGFCDDDQPTHWMPLPKGPKI